MDRKHFLKSVAFLPVVTFTLRSKDEPGFGCKTVPDAEGPFYKPNAPMRNVITAEGSPLVIEGKVLRADDCKTPVGDAAIDIWHCDNHGDYDMEGFNCRASFKTDKNGNYSFTTILPPAYGSRPKHIHFKIRAEGYDELTTQLYFEGDPNIRNDFARNAGKDRVILLIKKEKGQKGVFNIYL
jgi:catechol 1,2-dioxygenase